MILQTLTTFRFFIVFTVYILFVVGIPQHKFYDPSSEGTFWHITDIHVDQNYSRTGNPGDLCHESNSLKVEDNGIYGNFFCDSPQKLVDLTIETMKSIQPNPDFILWTGDNLPHTRNPNPSWDVVLMQINNITSALAKAFPGVQIYPSIGNHDTFPPNMLDPTDSQVYDDYFEKGGWKQILPKNASKTFLKGGYYSHVLKPGLKIISLNTILWYQSNGLVENLTDPSQTSFFVNELNSAKKKGEKVYIIGHVSPGYYNRIYNGQPSTPLYHLPYLHNYLQIIKNYSDVIIGQFFGHIHNDMFQLYYCDTGNAYSSGLLAASVTPWHSNTQKNINVSLPVNPSIRLMYYDQNSFLPLDYEQYFFNLTEANEKGKTEQPTYSLLYTFTDAYDVLNLSTKSLVAVYENLKSDDVLFQKFFKYLTAGKTTAECDDTCRTAQLCSMGGTSEDEYKACMRSVDEKPRPEIDNSHTVAYAVSFVCIFILIAVVSVLYCRRKNWCRRETKSYSSYSGF